MMRRVWGPRVHTRTARCVGLVISLVIVLASTGWAQEGGRSEGFDDPDLPGWIVTDGVSVDEGRLRISTGGEAALNGCWENAAISVRLLRGTDAELRLRYRAREEDGYVLRMTEEGLAILRVEGDEALELGRAEMSIPVDAWVEIEVTLFGGGHFVEWNGVLLLAAIDASPLPAGGVRLEASSGTGTFDDLRISEGWCAISSAED